MIYYNTLDLDKTTKEQLQIIENKIKKCKYCLNVIHKDSSTKGYHILISCRINCDTCRFVFDDAKRYEIDFKRESKFQNTLFEKKEFFRGNMKTLKKKKNRFLCENCQKRGVQNQELNEIVLDLEQVRQKMIYGKIKAPPMLVYLGYRYFECPICRWFKFIKLGELTEKEECDICNFSKTCTIKKYKNCPKSD